MNQSDFNDEILRNIGGKAKNNLNEILNNFTDTDFEIDTFSESPYIDIDSLMPPSHSRDFILQTNTNWHSLRIAQHRIDSHYFVLVRCHFRISSQANTNVLKCSKHSYWP